MHHRPGRYRRLATAVEAFVSVRPALQQRGACAATGGADKPLRPTPLQQERRATRLVGKARLKLAQRSRPSHACPLPPDADHRRTAPSYYILTNLGQRDEPPRDERFTLLSSFPAVVQMVTTIPNFAARFGNDNSTRLVLQFLYQYFRGIDAIKLDDATFETLWQNFWLELIEEPDWLYRTVSNLRCFHTERPPPEVIDLGDGVTIRGLSSAELKSLGFGEPIWDHIPIRVEQVPQPLREAAGYGWRRLAWWLS